MTEKCRRRSNYQEGVFCTRDLGHEGVCKQTIVLLKPKEERAPRLRKSHVINVIVPLVTLLAAANLWRVLLMYDSLEGLNGWEVFGIIFSAVAVLVAVVTALFKVSDVIFNWWDKLPN